MPLARQHRRSAILLLAASTFLIGGCSKDDPVGVAEPCDLVSAETPVALQPLQGTRVSYEERGTCANLSEQDARYLVIPQFATQFRSPNATDYFVGNSEVESPARIATLAARASAGRRTAQSQFDARLRALEGEYSEAGALLGRQLRERSAGSLRVERLDGATVKQFAASRTFKTLGNTSGTSFKTVTATLKYSGANIVVYVDNDAPAGFSDEAIDRLGALFDARLFPLGVATFGEPSDIDGNDRVVVLMTPQVNALVSANSCRLDGFITGYFFGFDLASTSGNSNKGEVFYTLVPDVTGQFSCAHAVADVEEIVPATFIHELQHMISYNQHVIVRGGQEEDTWLNEGLSLIAEETVSRFYEARYPPPLGREFEDQLFPDSSQGFITNNLVYAYDYLKESRDHSVTTFASSGSLEERGAAFLFLRWLLDQKGEGLARQLVQSNLTGVQNVAAKAGEPFENLFGDFAIAVYTDSLPGVARDAVPSRYRFSSRNLRRLFSRLFDIGAVGPFEFPVVPAELPSRGGLTSAMVPGTMSYYVLEPGAAAVPLHLVRSDQRELDPALAPQISVFRLP